MLDFQFHIPTNIVFGKDAELKVGEELKKIGSKVLLLHYGAAGKHIYESGLYDRIIKSIEEAGLEYVEMEGVVPNPRVSLMREGVELCKKEGIDCILGVGGGSVFDSCKGIAVGVCNDLDILDYTAFQNEVKEALPVGCIVTIPAAGSEVSASAMVVNDDNERLLKPMITSQLIRPKFAILNPELTYTLPPLQTAAGAMDIISHTLERYLGNNGGGNELIDRFAESVITTVLNNAPIALKEPENYNARAQIMICASLCHSSLLDCGVLGDWGTHGVENAVTTLKDIPHGVGLATVTASYMRHIYKNNMTHFIQFATRVMGVPLDVENPERTILRGISRFENEIKALGLPTSISEVGCTEEDIEGLINVATLNGKVTVGMAQKLNGEDLRQIYQSAL